VTISFSNNILHRGVSKFILPRDADAIQRAIQTYRHFGAIFDLAHQPNAANFWKKKKTLPFVCCIVIIHSKLFQIVPINANHPGHA